MIYQDNSLIYLDFHHKVKYLLMSNIKMDLNIMDINLME